jgi:hypothetical protein
VRVKLPVTKKPQPADLSKATPSSAFRKGDQVLWRGKKAKIENEVILNFDLVIKCEDGEVVAVAQSDHAQ